MGLTPALTFHQIVEPVQIDERSVRRDMKRGLLPSQEPEVVGQWLRERFSKDRALSTGRQRGPKPF